MKWTATGTKLKRKNRFAKEKAVEQKMGIGYLFKPIVFILNGLYINSIMGNMVNK
jgi:hypothetical protein